MNNHRTEKIRDYLDEHPAQTRQQITSGVGLSSSHVRSALSYLRQCGEVCVEKSTNGKVWKWSLAEPSPVDTQGLVQEAIRNRHPLMTVWGAV